MGGVSWLVGYVTGWLRQDVVSGGARLGLRQRARSVGVTVVGVPAESRSHRTGTARLQSASGLVVPRTTPCAGSYTRVMGTVQVHSSSCALQYCLR